MLDEKRRLECMMLSVYESLREGTEAEEERSEKKSRVFLSLRLNLHCTDLLESHLSSFFLLLFLMMVEEEKETFLSLSRSAGVEREENFSSSSWCSKEAREEETTPGKDVYDGNR